MLIVLINHEKLIFSYKIYIDMWFFAFFIDLLIDLLLYIVCFLPLCVGLITLLTILSIGPISLFVISSIYDYCKKIKNKLIK